MAVPKLHSMSAGFTDPEHRAPATVTYSTRALGILGLVESGMAYRKIPVFGDLDSFRDT